MKVEQIYTGCLSQGAYYIESDGEAAVIDPLREVDQYIELAAERNASIKYIFETHFHADFVSGHVDLSRKTGAPIIFGPEKMDTGFDAITADDGQVFRIGGAKIKVIHTPGHTLESTCYLLIDESGNEKGLFSGDTLFIGDVGRPDLAQHVAAELTAEKLAGLLYDSLRNKIMTLSDHLIIYPGHGAGSACGKNLSNETSDTLGNQRRTNYALRANLSKDEFVKEILAGLTPAPAYFPKNVLMNVRGYEKVDEVLARGTKPLSIDQFDRLVHERQALVLDTRHPTKFVKGFIPGSWNIGLDGSFAVWVGTLIKDIKQEIVMVADPGREKEAVTRLARVGYDNALGYLDGGFYTWERAGFQIDRIPYVSASDLEPLLRKGGQKILDVRKKTEFLSGHIIGAINAPLDYIEEYSRRMDKTETYYIHCAGGYRSMIFASILKSRGYKNVIDVEGGFTAIKASGRFMLSEAGGSATMS